MTETLGDALPKEIARVTNVIMPHYLECGPSGYFALAIMRDDLDRATKALAQGDVAAMAVAYEALKGWHE